MKFSKRKIKQIKEKMRQYYGTKWMRIVGQRVGKSYQTIYHVFNNDIADVNQIILTSLEMIKEYEDKVKSLI